MIPKMPPRGGQVGYIYIPPYRIQGVSIAAEQTMIQVPELDLSFDIGLCPRIALTSSIIALSHGHMDHVAALPYYFSQRVFQGMDPGVCLCHEQLRPALERMMETWVDVENQRTPHSIVGMQPGDEHPLKNNMVLRALEVSHRVPSLGYAVIEHRTKLRDEFHGLPQSKLRDLKMSGTEITRDVHVPLVAYTGDTEHGPYLYRPEFSEARIVVAECTFFDPDHRRRSKIGKHIHVEDLLQLLEVWQAEAVILTHLSRRSSLRDARRRLDELLSDEDRARVHILMDHQANRRRYEKQCAEAQEAQPTG